MAPLESAWMPKMAWPPPNRSSKLAFPFRQSRNCGAAILPFMKLKKLAYPYQILIANREQFQ
jgi:hypothetical protein